MQNNPNEWWKDRCDGVFRGDQFDLVEDMMNESRSRFKEEAVRALEGKKRCPDPVTEYFCVACEESGHEARSSQDCVDVVIQDAIETIKKL